MSGELTAYWASHAPAILAAAALIAALLIVGLRPLLARYAMAQPNARSSHKTPTPQGGGIAVIVATIVVASAALYFGPAGAAAALRLPVISAAIVLIACVGVLADIHPEHVASRLLLQTLAVAVVIFVLPPGLRTLPILPPPVERFVLLIGALWFVNLVNFMDGLDWMTVAEVVPITAALAAIGLFGILPPPAIVVSMALCGAMIGFAYFNRPVAKLFLGDVGSLPIGLVLGWLLILLAGNGGRAAAILLPLYYVADSTITLIRRALNRERIWQAHRSHFYQRATDRGFSVIDVVTRVFAVNLVLAALAIITVIMRSRLTDIAALTAGVALVAWLLFVLAHGRSGKRPMTPP
jgi:UDP-N-acetylmuramyl pentapeptide phosphotransferase/UDP-N-acetylglucosamine-1-phosphate transferase